MLILSQRGQTLTLCSASKEKGFCSTGLALAELRSSVAGGPSCYLKFSTPMFKSLVSGLSAVESLVILKVTHPALRCSVVVFTVRGRPSHCFPSLYRDTFWSLFCTREASRRGFCKLGWAGGGVTWDAGYVLPSPFSFFFCIGFPGYCICLPPPPQESCFRGSYHILGGLSRKVLNFSY